MMVLFSHRIRIQRVKIHTNSRVSTLAQYTFFLGLRYYMKNFHSSFCKEFPQLSKLSRKTKKFPNMSEMICKYKVTRGNQVYQV